jgi:type I restriction enzyme S subunit
MIKDKISNHIHKPISGEWGDDCDGVNCRNVLRTTNFTHLGNVKYDEVVRRTIDESVFQKKRLYKNDIIIEKSGGSDTIAVGRVVFFDLDDDNYTCNNFTSILRCKKTINPKYLHYCLYNNHRLGLTAYYQNKTTGIRNLQLTRYMDTEIPLFPLPQQEKIVSVLDTASVLVEKQKALLKKYDLFLKSKFIEMFGDPVKNPMGWEFTSLKNFGKIITGNTPPRQIDEYYNDDFIEWVKTDNIKSENMYVGQAAEYLSESGMKKARTLESGALLITCIAGSLKSIGTSSLTNRKISFNQQINAIQPYKDIHPYFLYEMFKVSKSYIQTFATASMKKIITKGEFETIELIKPPYNLQTQFAQIVEQTEALKQKEQQKLEKLQTLYDALMKRAFDGEIF